MTEPLFYQDPLASTFQARLIEISRDRKELILDRTLFYPQGGGQPGDQGTLENYSVIDTQKDSDGRIIHILESPLPGGVLTETIMTGKLNWEFRFDYMQQHTGQHLLSGALFRIAGANTVSVHQGTETTTIEIDLQTLSRETLEAVEDEVNYQIRLNAPVKTFTVDHQELHAYPLRRPTNRTGIIRLVEIEGIDRVACGGVHLPRTGLLNLVQTVGSETIRNRLRLAFKIGNRALRDYRESHRGISRSADLFSCRPGEVPHRIKAAQEELQDLHRDLRLRTEALAQHILKETGSPERPRELLLEDEPEDLLKALAEAACDDPQRRIILVNRRRNEALWAIVVGETHPFPQEELRKNVLTPLQAKGGGKPPLWRGALPDASPERVRKMTTAFLDLWP
ncbi:alanyl-tRNA synthetase [Alkalispirochaeta americana]|uniref:Alanyl-tRNA synthetase n=1 Tax=Alkalispirochaeta americana TaxID=159291 RepID=A0A1N6QR84_9SPIO|nr:alanyl-tRNA editing protein [Alkalispirochaeta americana]SIQ18866.1 alanyl-tRNA synthetase [Alkalispirochaeta americana]